MKMGVRPNNHSNQLGTSLLQGIAAHKSNYWVGFVTDPMTAMFLLYWDARVLRAEPFVLMLTYVVGIVSWTLFEYVFHRWVYHRGNTLAHQGHRMHHESPKILISMPWFMTTGFLWLVWYLFGYRWHPHFVLSFISGLTTGFIFYGALHHAHHHFHMRSPWLRKLNAHHQIHHRFATVNFGVTNRFWDQLFGTAYRKRTEVADSSRRAYSFIERLAAAAQAVLSQAGQRIHNN